MRATTIHAPGDIRLSDVPDPVLSAPTDAIVNVVAGSICGSDLWPYRGERDITPGATIGHECVGVVEEVGGEVRDFRPGDFVIVPFVHCDNSCAHCRAGVQSACVNAGSTRSGQGEYVRRHAGRREPGEDRGHAGRRPAAVAADPDRRDGHGLARRRRRRRTSRRDCRRGRRRRGGAVRRDRCGAAGRGEGGGDVAPRAAPAAGPRVRRHPPDRRTRQGRDRGSRRRSPTASGRTRCSSASAPARR